MALELVKGAALLLALSYLQGFNLRLLRGYPIFRDIGSGLLFGAICIVGMMMPLEIIPGVIFDARSVVLSMSGLFGGPVVGGIAAAMGAGYRAWLGGGGAPVGVAVVLSCVALGLAYRYAWKRGWLKVGLAELFAFGLLVHGVEVLLFTQLPAEVVQEVMDNVAVPLIVVFTPATVILGALLKDNERRVAMEAALVKSENRFSKAFHSSPGLVAISTLVDGIHVDVNDQWLKTLGYTRDEVIGVAARDLGMWPDQDQRNALLQAFREKGSLVGYPTRMRTKAGDIRDVLLSVEAIDFEGKPHLLWSSIDVTERKLVEDHLQRSRKLEAVGHLTGGIAHDFNNILGIVMGNLELLRTSVEDERSLRRVDNALKGVKRGAELVRRLLVFAREDARQDKAVDVNRAIRSLEPLIAKSLTVSIHVVPRLADHLPLVRIDPGDFEDALLNLALNARDAMPDGGELYIETDVRAVTPADALRHPDARAGQYVTVTVRDTGHGMTAEAAERAFEPFFTTKDVGQGTGLGLSMVFGFVQRSGGHVTITSAPGEGASVSLCLPVAEGAVVDDEHAEKADSAPEGKGRVLVVDDEVQILEVAAEYLAALGYEVETATNGADALAKLKNAPQFDLLFSDVVMPNQMDGFQLANAAHDLQPALKILLTSGYTRKREELMADGTVLEQQLAVTMLKKPYTMSELAQGVSLVLDAPVDNGAS